MFERYTEKARRAVFFARYEASQFGSECIETEHLLLGILRDDKELARQVLPKADFDSIRRDVEKGAKPGTHKVSVSVDLPLSEHAKLALTYAMEEADRVNSKHIGTEHLLLGLLRNNEFASAKLLVPFDATPESLRKRVEALPPRIDVVSSARLRQGVIDSMREYGRAPLTPLTVEIHGKKWNLEQVRSIVARLKSQPYLWERKLWQARNVVYERNGNALRLQSDLRESKVKNLRLTAIGDQDIGWLDVDVSVNDPLRVRSIQRISDLDAQIEHGFDLHRLASDPVPERLTFK